MALNHHNGAVEFHQLFRHSLSDHLALLSLFLSLFLLAVMSSAAMFCVRFVFCALFYFVFALISRVLFASSGVVPVSENSPWRRNSDVERWISIHRGAAVRREMHLVTNGPRRLKLKIKQQGK
jgi:hypothetical protein